jgi:hypothetical protein
MDRSGLTSPGRESILAGGRVSDTQVVVSKVAVS